MTVVAYDGSTIAVDRQATSGNVRSTTRKWRQLAEGTLLIWAGSVPNALAVAKWYEEGGERAAWPECQRGEDWARVLVLRQGVLLEYESEPHAQPIVDPISAWGSGRDLALGAMAHGASAYEAVEIASQYDVNCGMGVDVFNLAGKQIKRRGRKPARRANGHAYEAT